MLARLMSNAFTFLLCVLLEMSLRVCLQALRSGFFLKRVLHAFGAVFLFFVTHSGLELIDV